MAANMQWYSQLDPQWCEKQLGNSGLTCRESGCHIISIANMFLHAGRTETPTDLIDNLPDAFPNPKENIDLSFVMMIYPFIKYAMGQYALIKGVKTIGEKKHIQFLAKMSDGKIVNSFQEEGYPENFHSLASFGLGIYHGCNS